MASRTLEVKIVGDASAFKRAIGDAESRASKFGRGAARAGAFAAKGLAVGGAAALAAGFKLTSLAGDAAEVESKFKVVFGRTTPRLTKELDAFAKATGASRYELREQTADLGALLRPMVGSTRETGRMSVAVAKLSTDLSSFNNVPTEETLLAIRAGLVGEAEPLRRFGVLLNEAKIQAEAFRITGKKNADQLTDAEKVQARFNLIMRETKLAQGDATRTSGSWANQLRRLKNSAKDAGVDVGKVLLPAATGFVSWINKRATPALEDFSKFLGGVFKQRTFTGKVKFALKGASELAKQFGEAVFGEQTVRHRVVVDGGRVRIVMRRRDSVAKQFADNVAAGIEGVDWGHVGLQIAEGMKEAAKVAAPVVKSVGKGVWEGLFGWAGAGKKGPLSQLFNRLGSEMGGTGAADRWVKDHFTNPIEKGARKGFGALRDVAGRALGSLQTESAHAATTTSTKWQASLNRTRTTSARALADVRGQFRATGGTALTASSRVEGLRGNIARVKGKTVKVQANVAVKFDLPPGFKSDAFGRMSLGGPSGDLNSLDVALERGIRANLPTKGTAYMRPPATTGGVRPELWDDIALGNAMGLHLSSGFRVSKVHGTNTWSDHAFGKAIDMAGPTSSMARYALAMAGRPGIQTVIYSGLGRNHSIWRAGRGWYAASPITYGDHHDHVHADLFDRGGRLPRGLTLAVNKLTHDETILPVSPERLAAGLGRGGRGGDIHVHIHAGVVVGGRHGVHELAREVGDVLERDRRVASR